MIWSQKTCHVYRILFFRRGRIGCCRGGYRGHWGINWASLGTAVPFLHIQDKEHSCFLTTKQECSFIIRPKQGTVPVLNRNLREGKKEHV
ncbi:hypothetical protein HMPREF0372_03355 [Flavonifractor plautii ATCC 29863]|uniref:Uncharacterized protein n=1 Tax=Flavonifractor plautii ATCC 29863 TaxID=411475 RepID=G9YUZ0_FLAPL|nr:hypothetical protein HMPREF0372_03355 [Flavonifractor plautii ATCC 29863]